MPANRTQLCQGLQPFRPDRPLLLLAIPNFLPPWLTGQGVLSPLIQKDVTMLCSAVVLLGRPKGLLHMRLVDHIHQLVI